MRILVLLGIQKASKRGHQIADSSAVGHSEEMEAEHEKRAQQEQGTTLDGHWTGTGRALHGTGRLLCDSYRN